MKPLTSSSDIRGKANCYIQFTMTIYECRTWDIEAATLYVTMVIQYRKYVVEFVGLHKIHVLNKLLVCILGIEPLPCLSCVHETQYWA